MDYGPLKHCLVVQFASLPGAYHSGRSMLLGAKLLSELAAAAN
jgi:hypothetical protein